MINNQTFDIVVIGGGAAGLFFSANVTAINPSLKVLILEKSSTPLNKVRVSGGGRCNVTNSCENPKELSSFYPRGSKELLPLFHSFGSSECKKWFEERGVKLKAEPDGRVFPESNKSETIVDCLLQHSESPNTSTVYNTSVTSIKRTESKWSISTSNKQEIFSNKIFIATGSSSHMWEILSSLGHEIIPPVPSLFSFKIDNDYTDDITGISIQDAEVKISGLNKSLRGPVLFTHEGISGPAILKLSALCARELHHLEYHFSLSLNLTSFKNAELLFSELNSIAEDNPLKYIYGDNHFNIPRRLWNKIISLSGINQIEKWRDLSKKKKRDLTDNLFSLTPRITGKSTNKDEFVTCGGINRKEINWKRMESKILDGIYFGGEVIDVDALTGGFNFQAAWTTAYTAAKAASGTLEL